jgi:hypothetical protein
MLSKRDNAFFSKDGCSKKKRKVKTTFDIEDPRDASKVLKFSPHLEHLIIEEKIRDTDYLSDKTDRYTAFKWKYKTI